MRSMKSIKTCCCSTRARGTCLFWILFLLVSIIYFVRMEEWNFAGYFRTQFSSHVNREDLLFSELVVSVPSGNVTVDQEFLSFFPRTEESAENLRNRMLRLFNYVPPHYHKSAQNITNRKRIFVNMPLWFPASFRPWMNSGDRHFKRMKCPVSNCEMTIDPKRREGSHAVIFQHSLFSDTTKGTLEALVKKISKNKEIVILYNMEPPYLETRYKRLYGLVNWTMTYRLSSTFPLLYDKLLLPLPTENKAFLKKDFARGRTKKVAWLVSSCHSWSDRMEYAKELAKYIHVDILGKCTNKRCPTARCFQNLTRDYKFYLTFENTHCFEYVTEKLYRNAFSSDLLPIVRGARKKDYEKLAPPKSFIFAEDFSSPKQLAQFLHAVDQNDSMYNSYFEWKSSWKMYDYRDQLFCVMCGLVHGAAGPGAPRVWYKDIDRWFHGDKNTRPCWR